MLRKRVAVVLLELTHEQRAQILRATGSAVSEALVAGLVDEDTVLRNEYTGPEVAEMAAAVLAKQKLFRENLERHDAVKDRYLQHIGHGLDWDIPQVAILR